MSFCRLSLVLAISVLAGGCALLPTGKKTQSNRIFLIAPDVPMDSASAPVCGSVQVASGQAATGFRTARMAYMESPFELNYFAYARWGDAPSRMLAEQLRQVLRTSGGFSGVLESPVAARTDFHLELADVTVVQRFNGASSTLDITFETRMFDSDRRTLIATQRFGASEPAGENSEAGVQAANRAAGRLLSQVATFALEHCVTHAN